MIIPDDMLARLAPRQRQVVDYFTSLSEEQRLERGAVASAARVFKCSYGNMTTHIKGIRTKLGDLADLVIPPKIGRQYTEKQKREARAPKPTLYRQMEALEKATLADMDGMETTLERYDKIKPHVRAARTKELLDLTGWNALRIAASMSDLDIARASLKDKAIAFGILTEKRQLLAGEPTQIVSFEDRRKIPELLKALSSEFARRGRTIDVTPTHDSVEIAATTAP